ETGLGGASQADAAVASAIASASAEPATAVAVGSTGDGAAAAAISAPDVLTSPTPRSASLVGSTTARAVTTATVAGSHVVGNRIKQDSNIVLRFARPVTLVGVRAAFAIKPAVKGVIRAASNRVFTFIPAKPLAANTTYTITFHKAIKDTSGVA